MLKTTTPRTRTDWAALLQPARDNPAEWVTIEAFTSTLSSNNINSVAHHIRRGRYAGIEAGEFEVVVETPVIHVRLQRGVA